MPNTTVTKTLELPSICYLSQYEQKLISSTQVIPNAHITNTIELLTASSQNVYGLFKSTIVFLLPFHYTKETHYKYQPVNMVEIFIRKFPLHAQLSYLSF